LWGEPSLSARKRASWFRSIWITASLEFSTGTLGESSPAQFRRSYIGNLDGYSRSAADGKKLWAFKTQSGTVVAVVVGDRVLIGSYDQNLYCLSNATVNFMEGQNGVHATPGIADGVAYIAGCDEVFPRDPHLGRGDVSGFIRLIGALSACGAGRRSTVLLAMKS
jgi:outer membrane protein assembly factor BamB